FAGFRAVLRRACFLAHWLLPFRKPVGVSHPLTAGCVRKFVWRYLAPCSRHADRICFASLDPALARAFWYSSSHCCTYSGGVYSWPTRTSTAMHLQSSW